MEDELYEIIFNEDAPNVFGISLVEKPANKSQLVYLSDYQEIKLSEPKKGIVYGVVLRPNQIIKRSDHSLYFSEETIEKLSHHYLSKQDHRSRIDHKGEWLEGVHLVESWVVSDNERDKINALGIEAETGSWVVGMKLSEEVQKDFVETGKVKGFSIDSFLETQKVNKNNNKNMKNKETFLNKITGLFKEFMLDEDGTNELDKDAYIAELEALVKNLKAEIDMLKAVDSSANLNEDEDKPEDEDKEKEELVKMNDELTKEIEELKKDIEKLEVNLSQIETKRVGEAVNLSVNDTPKNLYERLYKIVK